MCQYRTKPDSEDIQSSKQIYQHKRKVLEGKREEKENPNAQESPVYTTSFQKKKNLKTARDQMMCIQPRNPKTRPVNSIAMQTSNHAYSSISRHRAS